MAKVSYSKAAINDLEQIGDYIAEQFKNPGAALSTVNKIQDAIDMLADFPHMGDLLSSIADVSTDYRFLVCGSYLAFYHVPYADKVLIDRILYGRRDYLSILFGELPQE